MAKHPVYGHFRPQRTQSATPQNAGAHLKMIQKAYSFLNHRALGDDETAALEKLSHYLTKHGLSDVKVFHNPQDVTIIAGRDPQTNMLFVSALGVDNVMDKLSVAVDSVKHVVGGIFGVDPKSQSPIGGKVSGEVLKDLYATNTVWGRMIGRPDSPAIPKELQHYVNAMDAKYTTAENPLNVSAFGHSLGAPRINILAGLLAENAHANGKPHLVPSVINAAPVRTGDTAFKEKLHKLVNGNILQMSDPDDLLIHTANRMADAGFGYVPLSKLVPIQAAPSKTGDIFNDHKSGPLAEGLCKVVASCSKALADAGVSNPDAAQDTPRVPSAAIPNNKPVEVFVGV